MKNWKIWLLLSLTLGLMPFSPEPHIVGKIRWIMGGAKGMATAEITIDRTKHDIKYGSGSFFDNLGDNMINDDFVLTVNLAF